MYIHLATILEFIANKEKRAFKLIKSRDFGVKGALAFKAIVPETTEIKGIELKDGHCGFTPIITDKQGANIAEGPIVILWESELYATEEEQAICLSADDMDNGLLVFENFTKIPEYVAVEDIIAVVEGRGL